MGFSALTETACSPEDTGRNLNSNSKTARAIKNVPIGTRNVNSNSLPLVITIHLALMSSAMYRLLDLYKNKQFFQLVGCGRSERFESPALIRKGQKCSKNSCPR